jgi:hypothetical protein
MSGSDGTRLTIRHAYFAMFEFLRQRYERGPTDEIGGLLGSLSLLADGGSADPAMLADFENAVAVVIAAESTPEGYTEANLALG